MTLTNKKAKKLEKSVRIAKVAAGEAMDVERTASKKQRRILALQAAQSEATAASQQQQRGFKGDGAGTTLGGELRQAASRVIAASHIPLTPVHSPNPGTNSPQHVHLCMKEQRSLATQTHRHLQLLEAVNFLEESPDFLNFLLSSKFYRNEWSS